MEGFTVSLRFNMPDKFGGIEVQEVATDQFGGVPVAENEPQTVARGGIGRPVTDPKERERIAAERMVQRSRESGQKDLFLTSELGLDPEKYGNVVSLGNTITKAYIAAKGLAKGSSLGVAEPIFRGAESAILSDEQRQALGQIAEGEQDLSTLSEAVGAVSPTGKIVSGVQAAKGFVPRLSSAIKQGFTTGAISGVSGELGEKGSEATVGGVTERGLQQGGLSALISAALPAGASAFRGSARIAESIKQTVSPEAKGLLKRALRFGTGIGKKEDQVVEDSLQALSSRGYIIDDLKSAENAAVDAKQKIYQEFKDLLAPNQDEVVDVAGDFSTIADDIISKNTGLKTAREALEKLPENRTARDLSAIRSHGKEVEAINDIRNVFGKNYSLEDAENQTQIWNSELARLQKERNISSDNLASDPILNATDQFRKKLKDRFLAKLSSLTGKDQTSIQALRNQYGSLVEFEEAARKRAIVSGRQAPLNLPQTLQMAEGVAQGIGDITSGETGKGVQQILARTMVPAGARNLNDPDNLIRRAFEAYGTGQGKPGVPARLLTKLAEMSPSQREASLGAAIANAARLAGSDKQPTPADIDREMAKILNQQD